MMFGQVENIIGVLAILPAIYFIVTFFKHISKIELDNIKIMKLYFFSIFCIGIVASRLSKNYIEYFQQSKVLFLLTYVMLPFSVGILFVKKEDVDLNVISIFYKAICILGGLEIILRFSEMSTSRGIRISGFTGLFNNYGLIIGTLLLYEILILKKRKILNIFIFCILIILAGSRGNIIAIFIFLLIYYFITPSKNKKSVFIKIIKSISIIILVFSLIFIIFSIDFNKFNTNFSQEIMGKYVATIEAIKNNNLSTVTGERSLIKDEFIDGFRDNIAFGHGFANQQEIRWDPHNAYIEILGELGLVGFIPFLILSVYGLVKSLIYLRKSNYKTNRFIAMVYILYWIEAMFSGTIYTNNTIWFLIAIL